MGIAMLKRYGTSCCLIGGAFAGGLVGALLLPRLTPSALAQGGSAGPPPVARVAGSLADPLSERFEAVARRLGPAVVAVAANKPSGTGSNAGKPVEESGSGILLPAPDGRGALVLTNNHVIAGTRPEEITAHLADGRVFRPHQVLADPETDIAV